MEKEPSELTWADFQQFPIWVYQYSSANDWVAVPLPVKSIQNLPDVMIGAEVSLADGTRMGAMLETVSRAGQKVNEHFLRLQVWRNDVWIHLSRYHDFDYDRNGPEGFARLLGKSIDEVFPIAYDLRDVLDSDSDCLVGVIPKQLDKHFTKPEVNKLLMLLHDPSLPWPMESFDEE